MKTMDQEDDYRQLEIGLEQAQIKLKEVISSLNSCPFVELTENGRISRTDCDQNTSFDFESLFAQNGLLDVRGKDLPASFQGCADVTNRPDRPLTLSRPGQLPSCCNFRGQHWRLYVQGEFSYSSLPRHFKNADKELNSSYKDDLENIFKDLRRKEEIVEYDRMFRCSNLPGSKVLNRSRSISNGENFSPTAPEAKSKATHRQQAFIPYKGSTYASDDITNPEPSSLSHKGDSSQNKNLSSQEEESIASLRNECLIEDINRNCTDIRNQLAVLESVSEMIDRAKVNFSVKTRRTKNNDSASSPLATGLQKLPQNDNSVVVDKSFDKKTEACSATFHKTDETQSTVVLKTPPQPPSPRGSLLKLNVTSSGSSSYSSPSKKLKSRKSRNRSLQRCGEDRLPVSERRSRTLSPSITERLDHRISRATQTCHNSVTFDCLPQTTNAERPNSEMESHDTISSQGQGPVVAVEQNGHQGNVQQNDNLGKNGKLGKQCQEGMKSSPFLSQDRKSAIKNSLSFSFRARPYEKKQSLLKQDMACSAEATHLSVVPCTDVSKADQHCQHSESLLDKMHKKLYPYQYNKQSRKRPTEGALGLSARKNVGPSSSWPISAALPQAKSPSLPLPKLHHCVNENSDCSSPTVLQAVTSSYEIPVTIVKLSTYEDTLSGDLASPSSGYGELSPPSVKENASSCCYSKTLSPEQSNTSCSTPSPANCMHSSLKTIKGESSACTRKNSKDIKGTQLHAAEKMLVDTCEWLICAGFPQYVQLYREGHFPVELVSVESDHEFLDPNCLLILIQRITVLNRMTSMKIRLPLTSVTRDWFTGEMLFALSPIWNYDSNCHWWNRSDRTFAANWTKSCSLDNSHSLEHSRNTTILEGSLEFDGLTPVLTEVQDEASVHLTSGYESETSPMSTSSLGHKKLLPHLSSCSCSQLKLQGRNSADEAVSDCDSMKQITPNGNQERDWGEFLGSSQETVKQVPCGSRSLSLSNQTIIVQEDHEFKNIPNIRTGIEMKTTAQPSVPHRKVSLYCAADSSKLGESLTNDSCILFEAGNTIEAAKGKNRMSFYDSGDPQAELDMILAELYRNIGSLDETLNNIDDVDVDEAYRDSQKLSTDVTVSKISKDKRKLSYDMKSANADVNEIGISEISSCNHDVIMFENYKGSKPCAFYQSKKAFLSIRDLALLQKLCIIKLTSVFEMHTASSKSEIICPLRFRSSKKSQRVQEMAAARRRIFGVPPVVLLQKLGVPLPPAVTLAMQHLKAVARNSTGLFRKPGVQSRIQQLQNELENNIGFCNFTSVDVYDLADVLKRYFRELPETLLTPQASQLLLAIFTDLPSELHLETVQAVMLLLSDISRQVLHILLEFLSAIAHHSEVNQMNASNLAVCFLPSFFRPRELPSSSACHVVETESSAQATDTPDRSTSPIWDHKVAVMCLSFLISNASSAFQIPDFSWTMLQASRSVSKSLSGVDLVADFQSVNLPSLMQSAVDSFIFKDFEWIPYISKYDQTKLSWRIVDDDRLLPLWCCTTAIEAPPVEVLLRLKGEQHLWDGNLVKGRIVERLSEETDVFHYVLHISSQEAPREFCELRSWKRDRDRGSYVLAKISVFHPNVPLTGVLRAITIVSHYLIEPCGAGKSRVVHVSRVDIRGHLFDWYYNVYGRLVERHLYKLNRAFTPVTENTAGPETCL